MEVAQLLQLSLVWLTAGLMVIYKLGINEIIASLSMEAVSSGGGEELDDPVVFALTMFIIVLLWPIILFDNMNPTS